MNICGINKLTLMDFPERTACILFVGGCNMRCPYCHNSGLVTNGDTIDNADIVSYLVKRRSVLEGVVISGGEPTIYSDLPQYLSSIRQMGYDIKLDTNGSNADMLQHLIDNQLVDYVAMDIKNSLDRYPATCGSDNVSLDNIIRSISILINGSVPYEFRTTVVAQLHDNNSFVGIADMIEGADKFYLQRYSDNGETFDSTLSAPTDEQMEMYADIVRNKVPVVAIR